MGIKNCWPQSCSELVQSSSCFGIIIPHYLRNNYYILTFVQHYRGNDNKLRMAYRIYQHLTDEEFELMRDLNETRDIKKEDPWNMSKIQATQFLNADPDIRKEALNANAKGEISSEVEMNFYCAKRMVERAIKPIVEKCGFPPGKITLDVIEKVNNCSVVFILANSCTAHHIL